MRLATFLTPDRSSLRAGDVRGEEVHCFAEEVTVAGIVADGMAAVPDGSVFGLEEVELQMPYRPRAIFLVGGNYPSHFDAETVKELIPTLNPGEVPCLMKGPSSAIGPFDEVVRPAAIECLDYEGELMVIVGADGGAAGFAVANDISARDVGDRWQLTRHKAGDTFCPWGPWVTTSDEIDDPYSLAIRTWVDRELRQEGSTAEMVVRIDEIIEYLGKTIRLQAGDAILTGTPAGTGVEMRDPCWLQPGDVVAVEIEGLGRIENRVAES